MPDARKKPCSICRRWFRPDPRIGPRQRACGKADCQAARRQKTQAGWRARNPDHDIARRMQERSTKEQRPEPLRLPPPLSRLPWDLAQDQFGVQGADFIGVLGKVLRHSAQTSSRPIYLILKRLRTLFPWRASPIAMWSSMATNASSRYSNWGETPSQRSSGRWRKPRLWY